MVLVKITSSDKFKCGGGAILSTLNKKTNKTILCNKEILPLLFCANI